MNLIFEQGTPDDIEELAQLYDAITDYLECHTNYPGWRKGLYPNRDTALEGVAEGTLYVARKDGRIVGTVILSHTPEASYAQAAWHANLDYEDVYVVYTLAVHPHFLGMGIGERIMDFILEYSAKNNAKAVRLDVYEKNTPAVCLYKKYGFQYIDTVDLGYSHFGLEHFELYQKLL